jgi:hypothetical protein
LIGDDDRLLRSSGFDGLVPVVVEVTTLVLVVVVVEEGFGGWAIVDVVPPSPDL